MGIRKYATKKGGKTRYAVNIFNPHTGKTQWVGTYKNKEDAKTALSDADRRIRLGELLVEQKDVGFSDLVDEWLEIQTVNLRQGTKDDYTYTSKHLREFFKNKPVSTITHADVYRFVAAISGKGLSAHYVRKMVVRLSQIFKFAEDMGYRTLKPTAKKVGNLPDEPERQVKPLTSGEVRRLVEATPDYWKPLMLVMVTCGLRRGEAFGLVRQDIDLQQKVIRVTHQLVNSELVPLKTKRARRVIPLTTATAKALSSHLETVGPNELGLVFVSEQGTPVDYMNFRKRVWIPTVERAGLRSSLTLHDLRRTFASANARQGRSSGYLQDVMGHQQSSTTAKYYIGVYDEERQAAVSDLEDWLAQETRNSYGNGLALSAWRLAS